MKLLLDECVPAGFRSSLSTDKHQCVTVPEAGFAGKTNGELLALAEPAFDVFITLDKGFAYQQNLVGRRIAILLIRAKSARLADLLPHAQACLEVIATIKPGEIVEVGKEK
jgi:predicted nuclease of predicted toxin-antitoxin system